MTDFTGLLLILALIPMDPFIEDIANYSTDTIQTTDGGSVITGSLHRADGFVIKINNSGRKEWTTLFEGRGQVSSTVETNDGYIVTGYFPFVSIHKIRGFGFIASLAKDGKIKWVKPVEKGSYSEFHKVIQTQDGNFITVGLVANGDSEDGWVVKFSPKGELIWYRTCCDNSTEVFEDVKEIGYNEFMIFGTSDDKPLIATIVEKDDQIDIRALFFG